MVVISIGTSCNVKYQIEKHIGNSETLFFDWLITDIVSVNELLRCKSIDDILNVDSIKVDPDTPIVESNSKILITSLHNCISIHDVPIDPSDKDISDFIDKYKRRYNRIINIINSNQKIYFIREGYIDKESEQLFIDTIKNINKECKFRLVIVKENDSNSVNRSANLLEINVTSFPQLVKDWTTDWLDWKYVFDTISKKMNNNTLVIEPLGGLGNMLRVVFSYVKAAQRDKKKLIVIWKKSDACRGSFLDFFQPIDNVTFLANNPDKLIVDYNDCTGHPDFSPYKSFIYSELKLNQNICNLINEKLAILGDNFIAIQVRRTDHIEIAKASNKFTPDEDFCKFIESNPDGNLFITSDNQESYDYFRNNYPDRVKIDYPTNDPTKLRHTSLEDSIVDMFVCAKARVIKTSGFSSFGDLINQLHDNFIFSTL
jgi:hypothetical protein